MLVSDKQNQGTLKYMTLVTQDILAMPGVSISVDCLFSSLKHTLSVARSSMTAETVSVDIVTKEWLKAGLAEGKLHGFHQHQGSIEYIQIYSKYIHIHFPQYDMIRYRYDTAPTRWIWYGYEYDTPKPVFILYLASTSKSDELTSYPFPKYLWQLRGCSTKTHLHLPMTVQPF